MKKSTRKRASMLIVSLGVLTLLSVMAVTFAMLMMLEQTAAKNYVDGVRSNFLATSGKEAAVIFLKKSISDPNVLMNQNLKLRFPWIYNLGDYSVPLKQALMNANPAATVSYYGSLGNTYEKGRDQFGVKIIDTSSQFNLNNRFRVTTGVGGKILDPIYTRVLANLGEAISKTQGIANPINTQTAELILDYRGQLENQEYATKDQLMDILGENRYLQVKDYVTTRSWIDEKAVIASEESGGSQPNTSIGGLSSVNYQLSRRSPINLNTASKEVIMALIKDLGGRTVYTYNDINIETPTNKQLIDSQSTKWQISAAAGQKYEEKQNLVSSLYVWIEPFIFQEAQAIATNLVEYREKSGAYDNFQEFYTVIDLMFAGKLGKDIFTNYWNRVKGLVIKRISEECSDSGNIRNPFTAKGMDSVLENIYRKGAADCIKANFNPNACVSFFNPNSGAAKIVDKANLLYMPPGKQNSSYLMMEVRQTLDFCFNPMGIFEITSLGQVKSKDRIEAEATIRTIIWIYDAIRHTTQADFESNSDIFNATQRADIATYPEPSFNWEVTSTLVYKGLNKGGIPSGANQLDADKAVMDGRVELADASDTSGRGKTNASLYVRWNTKENGKSWSQENAGYSNYFGETNRNRDDRWAYAYENSPSQPPSLIRENTPVQRGGNLMPDGLYNTKFRSLTSYSGLGGGYQPRYVWYRSGYYDPTPTLPYEPGNKAVEQGEYSPDKFGGMEPNVDYYGGVIEFWYKPDKDWQQWFYSKGQGEAPLTYSNSYHNQGSSDLFMGFVFLSHLRTKAAADSAGKKTKSTGTQLFLYRTAFGDLRATRIYYEIIGEYPLAPGVTYPEEPLVIRRPLSEKVTKNVDKLGGDYKKYLGDGEAKGLKEYSKAYEMDPIDNGGTYEWPPKEIGAVTAGQLDNQIKRGRSDAIIHADRLRYIKAHEWHHFALKWDDSNSSSGRLEIKIDNQPYLTSILLPRTNEKEFEGTFSKLNEVPGENRDNIYIGSIFRKQLFVQSGVFKFTTSNNVIQEVCHGTIDDFYYFPLAMAGGAGIPKRYENSGIYTNAFSLQDKFSGGIQQLQLGAINWTAYLPEYWHSTTKHRVFPQMKLRLWLSQYDAANRKLIGMRPVLLPPGKDVFNNLPSDAGSYYQNGLLGLVDPKTGKSYTAGPNDWLVYQVELISGSPSGLPVRNVVSPSLDDISLTFFLPQPRTLLETFVIK